jgi:cation transport regulator
MPYVKASDLPDTVRDTLPAHAQETYRSAFNNAWDEYADSSARRGNESSEEAVHKVTGSAVKQKYHQEGSSERWVENS